MEVVVEVGAGLDVHKKTVVVCCLDGRSTPTNVIRRSFGTFRHQLEQLRDWLVELGCTSVAMESTGVYWVPVYRILEGHMDIVLGNARHMANVPGRKTDVNDAQWIAQLLRYGLIRRNFVPSRAIIDLRKLTRLRRKLIQMRSSAQLRVDKLLQMANIKLTSVASELFGVSGRLMLDALAKGWTNPQALAELSRGRLRKKRAELLEALSGTFTTDDAKLLDVQLRLIDQIEARLVELMEMIETKVIPHEPILQRLDTVPGINRIIAIEILAETGGDMTPWPNQHQFAAWCGVCPGNRESAGKRKRARTREGRPAMKSILAQAATSAALVHGSYLATRYRGVRARRGDRYATIVIAHELAVSLYFIIKREQDYQPPALADPQLVRTHRQRKLIRDLERLGYLVTCTER